MFANSDELLKYIKDEGVEMVDVRFCDLPGVMQHFTVPVSSFDQSVFDDGLGFDGSSIRGFQAIHESDMPLFPDPTTAYIDPFREAKTLVVNFFIHDPITGEAYSRDPRNIARKALAYLDEHRHRRHGVLRARGRVLRLRLGALRDQAEHRLLRDRLRRRRLEHRARRGRQPRLQGEVQGRLLPGRADRPLRRPPRRDGHRAREGRPASSSAAHHEVGTAGQAEINYRFDELLKAADNVMKFKYIVKNVALAQRQDRDLHAQADLRRQRLGHALPPVDLERRRAAVLRRDRLRAASPTWRATTSAACSSTPRRCWRSPTRR